MRGGGIAGSLELKLFNTLTNLIRTLHHPFFVDFKFFVEILTQQFKPSIKGCRRDCSKYSEGLILETEGAKLHNNEDAKANFL